MKVPSVQIVLVGSRREARQSAARWLREFAAIDVVAEGDSPADGVAACGRKQPHVLAMQIEMPGGDALAVLGPLRSAAPGVRVAYLCYEFDVEFVEQAIRDGARGIIRLDETPTAVAAAIRVIAAGGSYVSPGLDGQSPAGTQ